MPFSEGEQSFLLQSLKNGQRTDGRQFTDYRDIQLALGTVESAEGSARVKIGGTEVIAAVRPDLAPPSTNFPDVGTVNIAIDWSTCADVGDVPVRVGKKLDLRDVEAYYKDILLRSYYNSNRKKFANVDLRTLCVLQGKAAWRLQVEPFTRPLVC